MNAKPLLTAGLLLATTLILTPAPANADISVQYCLGLPSICNYVRTCNPPVTGSGGVVGDTLMYAGNVAAIGCSAAKQEAAVTLAGAMNGCDATMAYLLGSNCSLTCTCDPQPIGPITPVSIDTTTTMASSAWAIAPLSCQIQIKHGDGVVGDTIEYANSMGNIGCNTALAAAYIAAGAGIAICNETGDYLVGQPYWCTVYVVA